MPSTSAAIKPRSAKTNAFLGLRIVLALLFIAAAAAKLAGVAPMVAEFKLVGLGQWLRYFTALLEISGGVLLLVPGKVAYGAVLLGAVCVGAFFAQALVLHEDVIHPIILGGIFASILWFNRAQIFGAG